MLPFDPSSIERHARRALVVRNVVLAVGVAAAVVIVVLLAL
jgi:uncharacterized membrane protein